MFFLGIGLLCFTFYVTYSAFSGPAGLVSFKELISTSGGGTASEAVEILPYLIAIGLLLVMGYIAGKITKHGIDMFRSK